MKLSTLTLSSLAVFSLLAVGCSHKEVKQEEAPAPAVQTSEAQTPSLDLAHFDYDSAELTAAAKDILKKNAEELKKNPKLKIEVQGYTDSRGSADYNLALGQKRAEAVKAYLVSLGVPEQRITTASFGKSRLLDPGQDEQAHAKNRRAGFSLESEETVATR